MLFDCNWSCQTLFAMKDFNTIIFTSKIFFATLLFLICFAFVVNIWGFSCKVNICWWHDAISNGCEVFNLIKSSSLIHQQLYLPYETILIRGSVELNLIKLCDIFHLFFFYKDKLTTFFSTSSSWSLKSNISFLYTGITKIFSSLSIEKSFCLLN